MNIENQHKEWKESLRDEYIKWICGFANANVGIIYIGIAATFFRSGLIESWGRGTLKILNECLMAQLPPPVFKYDLSGFMIEFNQRKEIASGKTSGKTSEKVLTLISENHEITIPELSLSIGVSERSIERTINQLQKNRRLERIGGAKGGRWRIIFKTSGG